MPVSRVGKRMGSIGGMVLGLSVAVLGCATEPDCGERFAPPAEYRALWDSVEACSGRRGDFTRITWFVLPGERFRCGESWCAGEWFASHDIFLAERWRDNAFVVKHEMLHELLGHKGHPDRPFREPCQLMLDAG